MYYNLSFWLKVLTAGILFLVVVNVAFVAKPLILGILFSIPVIVALEPNFWTGQFVSGILFPNFVLCHT